MEYEFKGAALGPANFPEQDNSAFANVGTRTTYVPTSGSGPYQFEGGFPILKPTKLYSEDGVAQTDLTRGQKVHFTHPAKLFRGSDLGNLPKNFTYAAVSLTGWKNPVDGYVLITSVEKPSPKAGGRLAKGSDAQTVVANAIAAQLTDLGIEFDPEQIKTAPIGSQIPDVTIPTAKGKIQVEVKGASNPNAAITVFDKTVSRSKPVPHIVDQLGAAFIDGLNVRDRIEPKDFIGLVDYYRLGDSSIGFAGDQGVTKSGRLPPELISGDSRVLTLFRQHILEHFAEGGDSYFAVHDRSSNTVKISYTGHGPNVLNAPAFPEIAMAAIATYGGASKSVDGTFGTRVGCKIKLKA